MAPLIGITSTPEVRDDHVVEVVTRSFVRSVTEAGGLAVLLPSSSPEQADDVVARLDGLLLSGGGDVVPARYGQELHPETAGIDNGRDDMESALIEAAIRRDVPVLGVCRGLQMLNVDAGGTLIQHLRDADEQAAVGTHSERVRIDEEVHPISIAPGSLLRRIVGADVTGVNTLHHQAIDELGAGLVATAWSPDGVIEAIESTEGHRVLGVQWHPELLRHLPAHAALFSWLVAEAGAEPFAASGRAEHRAPTALGSTDRPSGRIPA